MSCVQSLPAGYIQNACAVSNTDRKFTGTNGSVSLLSAAAFCCLPASTTSIIEPCQFSLCNITGIDTRNQYSSCIDVYLSANGVDEAERWSVDEACYNAAGGAEGLPRDSESSTSISASTTSTAKPSAPTSTSASATALSSTIASNSTSPASTTGASTTAPEKPTGTSSTPSPSKSSSKASSGVSISLGSVAITGLAVLGLFL